MKITCLNCQKNYNLNESKIPTGVKTAKCKACGHPMPLKGKAPGKPSADTPVANGKDPAKPSTGPPVINRSCMYCGQTHALRRNKIPPGTTSIKCKSCGRPLPLKLEEATETELVHSLKKEAAKPAVANPPLKTAPQPARPPDVIALTCANCSNRYKIPAQKIPPTAKALKCRACGHRIKLPASEVSSIQQIHAPEIQPPSESRPRKKMRLYAMAAGILLLVMAGAFAGFKMYKDSGRNQLTASTQEPLAASSAFLKQEPFLALNLNLPFILNNIDPRVAKDKKTLKFRTTMSLVKSLKIKRLEVFLYADPQDRILPVILAWGSNARHLEKIFTRQEPFTKYFEHHSSGKYRLKQEALEETDEYSFPDEPYQMTLDLDPVDIPNAALAELTYEVRSIQTPDGKNILRADQKQFKPTINPGSAFPGSISLAVKNGTPPESLGTARIQFKLSMPDLLQIFEFRGGDEKGSQKNSGGIQVMAYDSFGKQLKQGSYSSSKGGNRTIYFWGQPARFEMDLSTKTLEKKIEFEIKQRPLAEKAYQAYKKTIDNQRSIVTTLKSIDRARRKDRSYYGDDLAGLFYLYRPKAQKPMRLFAQDIAHSDPAGQKRFGYKAKPYQGYYFTVLSGAEANSVNQAYRRRSKKSKFSWKKGRITTTALTRHPDLVAIPADKSRRPSFCNGARCS